MKLDLLDYIVHNTPEQFFKESVERLESAYFQAHVDSERGCDTPERGRVRGQLRHYYQNRALREAAQAVGLQSVAAHTDPKGERYSLISSAEIRYGRISVGFKNKIPRPAKHRKLIAALNGYLEPMNMDLFSSSTQKPADGLGALVVTINPEREEAQTVPKDIYIGVPYTNLKGWHFFDSVSQVLAGFHGAVEMDVPDMAWVTLKKNLRDNE
ncbi:hypothetical protein [Chromobacterium haemolyticum]|uniref:hypothetical protein n=1 Tax=Chromobacterium haemolyticum TaxID=394935 RepID=UPI0012DEC139|nr:hypothetical protein [Chromobacterium haemolyticum]